MKTMLAVIASALGSVCGLSGAEPEQKANPLVGVWIWADKRTAEFLADGTVKYWFGPAKWTEIETHTVERKYTIVWKKGTIVDDVTMDKDLKKLRVKNSNGKKFTAEKAPDVK